MLSESSSILFSLEHKRIPLQFFKGQIFRFCSFSCNASSTIRKSLRKLEQSLTIQDCRISPQAHCTHNSSPKMTSNRKHECFDEAAASRKVNLDRRLDDDVSNVPILDSKHKIFLSHSGFQKEFVEHLCTTLESRCRYPFFDKRPSSLPKGERFANLIFQAIEQCELLVVVISDEYFMSKWPMMELHAFVQTIEAMKHMPPNPKQKYILPLFYGLSVEEFRDKRRRKKWSKKWKTLAEDGGEKRQIDVNAWKKTLDVLGSYNGISYNRELQEIKAYEDEIVSHICGKTSANVKWDDSHVQGKSEICEVLCKNIQSVGRMERYRCKVIGIYGVGGIGKTTICKTLCNELSNEYEGRVCHVELDTKVTAPSLVESLRKAVILLTDKNSKFVRDLDEGRCRDILRNSALSPRTFLAVDNVWDNHECIMQAKTILGVPNFHEDSLVIVTARSRSTLELLGIRGDACVEMPGLGKADAAKLFLYHAAGGKQFAGEEEWLDIWRCIKRCYFDKGGGAGFHYHPLALQSLGVQLGCVGEKPSEWVEKLPVVRNFSYLGGGNPVFDILRSGFDLLRPSEQSLFMDLVVYRPFSISRCDFGSEWGDMVEWLCLVYREGEDEMKSRLDGLKRKGLLQDVDWTSGRINLHDLYVEFAELESKGKLDKSTDFEHRRCVGLWNGDLTELERRPSGGCWQKLCRLGIYELEWDHPAESRIESLEGIEWQFCSNVVVLELEGLSCVRGSLNLEGLKCLRSLGIFEVWGLDRVEGLERLRGLTIFKWERDGMSHVECKTRIVGQLPASLQVLDVKVGIWLEPGLLARCSKLCKLKLENVRAVELDLRSCSSLLSVCVFVRELRTLSLPLTARGACSLKSLEVWSCWDLAEIRGLDELTGLERLVLEERRNFEDGPDMHNRNELQVLKLSRKAHLERLGRLEVCIPRQLRELQYLRWGSSKAPNMSGFEQLEVLVLDFDMNTEDEATNLAGLEDLPALRSLTLGGCKISSGWPDLSRSRKLEKLDLHECEMELQEEDVRMLVSLPLLKPVQISDWYGIVELDLVRRKVLRRQYWWMDESEESDLGKSPIKIKLGRLTVS